MSNTPTKISMTDFRRNASDIVARVFWTDEQVILTSKGKPMVKLVSVRDDDESNGDEEIGE